MAALAAPAVFLGLYLFLLPLLPLAWLVGFLAGSRRDAARRLGLALGAGVSAVGWLRIAYHAMDTNVPSVYAVICIATAMVALLAGALRATAVLLLGILGLWIFDAVA